MRSVSFTILLITIALLVGAAPLLAQDQTKMFEETFAKVKSGDTASVDFKALRLAFAGSKYGGEEADTKLKTKLLADSKAKNFPGVLKDAEDILKVEPLNPTIYVYCATAATATKDQKRSELCTAIYLGIINSITGSGDGMATKTAYTVISADEELAVLNAYQLQKSSKESITEDGHKFDVITVLDKASNQTSKVYFNVDLMPVAKPAAMAEKKP